MLLTFCCCAWLSRDADQWLLLLLLLWFGLLCYCIQASYRGRSSASKSDICNTSQLIASSSSATAHGTSNDLSLIEEEGLRLCMQQCLSGCNYCCCKSSNQRHSIFFFLLLFFLSSSASASS